MGDGFGVLVELMEGQQWRKREIARKDRGGRWERYYRGMVGFGVGGAGGMEVKEETSGAGGELFSLQYMFCCNNQMTILTC